MLFGFLVRQGCCKPTKCQTLDCHNWPKKRTTFGGTIVPFPLRVVLAVLHGYRSWFLTTARLDPIPQRIYQRLRGVIRRPLRPVFNSDPPYDLLGTVAGERDRARQGLGERVRYRLWEVCEYLGRLTPSISITMANEWASARLQSSREMVGSLSVDKTSGAIHRMSVGVGWEGGSLRRASSRP